MAFPPMPVDTSVSPVPIGCVYVPGVGWAALQGTGNTADGSGNSSALLALGHAAVTVLNLPSLARATYTSGLLTVGQFVELAFDIKVTAFTGGASPTVTFKVSRNGVDGNLYQIYLPTAISVAGTFSTSIGSGLTTNSAFGNQIQVDMVLTGAPTSITFSGSLTGK